MNAKLKKILSLVMAALMVVTLTVSAVFALLGNVFTRNTTGSAEFGEIYEGGRYTSTIAIDEVKVGGMTLINTLSDMNYINLVVKTQALDAKIKDFQDQIDEKVEELVKYQASYKGSTDPDDNGYKNHLDNVKRKQEDIDEIRADRDEVVKELDEFHAEYEPEDFETLAEKLTDEKFINSLGLSYMFGSAFGLGNAAKDKGRDVVLEVKDPTEGEDIDAELNKLLKEANDDYNTDTPTTVKVLSILFGAVMLYAVIFITIIFGVILVINSIIKIIRILRNIKNADERLVDALQTKILIGFAAIGFILLAFVKSFAGSAITFGPAYILIGVAFIVNCIGGIFVRLVKDGFKSETVVKSGLSVISAVLAVVIIVVAMSACVGAVVTDKVRNFENVSYYEIYTEELIEAYKATNLEGLEGDAYDDAIKQIKKTANVNTAEYFDKTETMVIVNVLVATFMSIFTVAMAMCILERSAGRLYKTKMGDKREYGAQIALAVIVIACAIFMSVFSVNDIDGLNSTIEKGDYKVFVGEYKVEGTVDHKLYGELEEAEKLAGDAIAELEKQLDEVEGEDEKKAAVAAINNLKRAKGYIENSKAELEETAIPNVAIIVLTAILLALEIAYKVAPAKIAALLPLPKEAPAAPVAEEAKAEDEAAEAVAETTAE